MQHVPDERLYRVSGRWEDYTNYGILQDFSDSVGNIFPLQMDTWYYDNAFAPVGHMDLGESGITEQLGVRAWLARQVHAFEEAFSEFVQLHTDADGQYWDTFPDRRSLPRNTPRERHGDDAQPPPDSLVTGTTIRFDARATIRGPHGYIGDIWLRNVGALQVGARRIDPAQPHAAASPIALWEATLHLEIVSLFLLENQAALMHTRDEWKRLRTEDPTQTIDLREDPPALVAVTLVEPPPTTPLNNQELYVKNGPHLARAISMWENRADYPFIWDIRDR